MNPNQLKETFEGYIKMFQNNGYSISKTEKACGISNGMIGKILKGERPISESVVEKLKSGIESFNNEAPPKEEKKPNIVEAKVLPDTWYQILSDYIKKEKILYVDLIEAYEEKKERVAKTMEKTPAPSFFHNAVYAQVVKPIVDEETEEQRTIRWGWNFEELNEYTRTVIPRDYRVSQFQNIINEEDNTIELMKLGAEIKKAIHIESTPKTFLLKCIVNKLNELTCE